jgi:hypothetical protein
MRFRAKSENPKSHLVICSAIGIFMAKIIEAEIIQKDGIYGIFTLDGSPEMIDSLSYLPGINLEFFRSSSDEGKE